MWLALCQPQPAAETSDDAASHVGQVAAVRMERSPDARGELTIFKPQPGITCPRVESAEFAAIEPLESVIGVSVGGRHRAYLLSCLSQVGSHIVNDLVGGRPLTVTYCARRDLARLFVGAEGSGPLTLGVAGWIGTLPTGRMALEIDGRVLPQDSPEIGLEELHFQRMPWEKWRSLHPDTDVFVGQAAERSAPRSRPAATLTPEVMSD